MLIRFWWSLILLFSTHGALWHWMHRLGGPGLILLGLADNSAVPLPGSMDVFTLVLASHRREWWFYYALMATAGAVLGGYVTYRLAEKGGEQTLEKRIGKQRAAKAYKKFEGQGGFWVFFGAILPPPFPIVPVLMAAGILEYPKRKFLAVLTAGRAIRFFAVAWLGRAYGTALIGWLSQYYRPVLYALIALGIAAGVSLLLYLKWYRPRKKRQQRLKETPADSAQPRVA